MSLINTTLAATVVLLLFSTHLVASRPTPTASLPTPVPSGLVNEARNMIPTVVAATQNMIRSLVKNEFNGELPGPAEPCFTTITSDVCPAEADAMELLRNDTMLLDDQISYHQQVFDHLSCAQAITNCSGTNPPCNNTVICIFINSYLASMNNLRAKLQQIEDQDSAGEGSGAELSRFDLTPNNYCWDLTFDQLWRNAEEIIPLLVCHICSCDLNRLVNLSYDDCKSCRYVPPLTV